MQTEWDYSSYVRKFHQSIAYVRIGEKEPRWTWIGAITDNHLVYNDPRKTAIGQIVLQKDEDNIHHDPEKYPVVEFLYKGFLPGPYWGEKPGVFYVTTRRHLKSYKIGLSDECYSVRECFGDRHNPFCRVGAYIDMNRPVLGNYITEHAEVFNRRLIRLGTTLFADGNAVGFMEGGVCVMRNPGFVPLIKPILGDRWQIES